MSALLTYFWPPVNFQFSLDHILMKRKAMRRRLLPAAADQILAADNRNTGGGTGREIENGFHSF
jgi:hypothetical protein